MTEGLPGVDGPFGGDLCLALLSARALFHANSRWFLNTSPPRVGADLCVRPDTLPHGTRARADTQVGPYGSYCNLHQTQNNGRGQSPAPTGTKGNEHPTPLRDLPGHPKPRLPQPKTPCMTAGTPPPVPTQKNTPARLRTGVSKGGRSPLWSFQGGPGGKTGLPPQTSAAFAVGKGGAAE